MFAVFARDLARDLQQAADRPLDARRPTWISKREQRGDDERGDEADRQRDPPVRVRERSRRGSFADRHLPQGAGGVEDPHARVVDPRDAGELGRLLAHDLDRLFGSFGLPGDPAREQRRS